MESFLISVAKICFPSFHFWCTNESCAFLLLIRKDTIPFCNHWVSKQRRQMALLTPDRKPCALLESAYFFSILLYLVHGLKMPEGDLCHNKKRSLFYSLGVSFRSRSNYISSVVFRVFIWLISFMFAVVFVLLS